MTSMSEVTRILNQIDAGDPAAAEKLLPLVYDELRKMAALRLSHENPGQTLQATALVHEAYIRLVGENHDWDGRGHFFSAAAESMRRILVENARRKQAIKHGGLVQRQELELDLIQSRRPPDEILALDTALDHLAEIDPENAELVKLRYFVGMSVSEAAETLGISPRTVDRKWAYVRAWLHQQINKDQKS